MEKLTVKFNAGLSKVKKEELTLKRQLENIQIGKSIFY